MTANSFSAYENFVLAGCSASCATVFTNPLEVVKTRVQLENELKSSKSVSSKLIYRNPAQAFWHISKAEGFRGLQTGLVTALGYQISIGGTRFAIYEPVKKALNSGDKNGGSFAYHMKNLAAGMTAGTFAAIAGNPFYLIKTRMQAANSSAEVIGKYSYRSGYDGFRSIWALDGLSGFYRGMSGAILRVSIGSGFQLSSYDFFKTQLQNQELVPLLKMDGLALHFSSSLLAGLFCVTSMNPFDVMSVRLYNQPHKDGKGVLYNGLADCIRKVYRTEGLMGFYKGWGAQYLRLGPHTIITFMCWEKFRDMYKEYREKSNVTFAE